MSTFNPNCSSHKEQPVSLRRLGPESRPGRVGPIPTSGFGTYSMRHLTSTSHRRPTTNPDPAVHVYGSAMDRVHSYVLTKSTELTIKQESSVSREDYPVLRWGPLSVLGLWPHPWSRHGRGNSHWWEVVGRDSWKRGCKQ